MKKVGFIMVFNEVNWISYAVDQAVKICDEVIICEGSQFTSFSDIPERSDDGTLDIIEDKKKEYYPIITHVNTIREKNNYRSNQCANFNLALDMCDIGDYFVVLDVDVFYRDAFLEELNDIMKENKVDIVKVQGYLYGFSFKWRLHYEKSSIWAHDALYKKVNGFRFVPTHKPHGVGKNKIINTDENIFHYTWLKPKERMRIRMKTSGFYPGMLEWFDRNWDKIELVENKPQTAHNKGSFLLERYEGPHPSVLDDHPWRYIEDVRCVV